MYNHWRLNPGSYVAAPLEEVGEWSVYRITQVDDLFLNIEETGIGGGLCQGSSGSPLVMVQNPYETNGHIVPLTYQGSPLVFANIKGGFYETTYQQSDLNCYRQMRANRVW